MLIRILLTLRLFVLSIIGASIILPLAIVLAITGAICYALSEVILRPFPNCREFTSASSYVILFIVPWFYVCVLWLYCIAEWQRIWEGRLLFSDDDQLLLVRPGDQDLHVPMDSLTTVTPMRRGPGIFGYEIALNDGRQFHVGLARERIAILSQKYPQFYHEEGLSKIL